MKNYFVPSLLRQQKLSLVPWETRVNLNVDFFFNQTRLRDSQTSFSLDFATETLVLFVTGYTGVSN